MRPMFVDTIVTEAGIDLEHPDARSRPDAATTRDRASAYREWRRSRVLFMHSVSEAERAVVDGVADLPSQRRSADL